MSTRTLADTVGCLVLPGKGSESSLHGFGKCRRSDCGRSHTVWVGTNLDSFRDFTAFAVDDSHLVGRLDGDVEFLSVGVPGSDERLPAEVETVEDNTGDGDATPGHNQVPIAYGDGAKAGISIHFALRDFPRDPDHIEAAGPVRSEEVPGIPDELLEQAVDFHTYD